MRHRMPRVQHVPYENYTDPSVSKNLGVF